MQTKLIALILFPEAMIPLLKPTDGKGECLFPMGCVQIWYLFIVIIYSIQLNFIYHVYEKKGDQWKSQVTISRGGEGAGV